MPVEIMLLPRWFPFHLDKISYWARTVLVPLLVLQALEAERRQSARRQDRRAVHRAAGDGAPLADRRASGLARRQDLRRDRLAAEARRAVFPGGLRRRAIDAAAAFVTERLNGEDGLGAIYPAMANAVLMFDALGYPPDHPDLVAARRSIERLLVVRRTRPIASPACRRSGTRRSPPTPCSRPAARPAPAPVQGGARLAHAAPDPRRQGRLGRPARRTCGPAAGPSSTPTPTTPTSTTPRWLRWRWTAPTAAASPPSLGGPCRGDRPRPRVDRGDAEPRRRLGRLRRRQFLPLSQPHPLRRPRRAARPADRRRHRPLRLDAGAARRDAGDEPGRWPRASPR